MESLQRLLSRVTAQLSDLTRSQRLAILLGGALVAVALIWLVDWAASPEMVPLLDQELEPADLARVRSGLELSNQPFKLVGNKVLVRANTNRQVIIAQLQQQGQLPTDTSIGFNALVKESNPWISQAEHERRWTVALKHEIESVLRQFHGVKSASVFLPLNAQRQRFARQEPATTASVTLVMQGGQPVNRELALAAARLVCGAVRGVPLRNVEVLDGNGVSALEWDSETAGISALERQRRQQERDIRAKIISQLPDPQARVGVQVELELTDKNSETEKPGDPVATKEETTSEETARARPSGQPGVTPNVGVATGGRLADEHTTKETLSSEYVPGFTRTRETTPRGGIKEVWAAVNISRSYLQNVYHQAQPDAEPPTEQQVQEVFDREKARIVRQLTKLVKPQDEDHLAVDWFYDTTLPTAQEAATQASSFDETLRLVRRYAPQSGLALLALLALGMMLRMARRTTGGEAFGLEIGLPKEAIQAAQRAARDVAAQTRQSGSAGGGRAGGPGDYGDVLEADVSAIGQAAMTEGVLVAQEVDERTVQTSKMLDQVAQVAESDPASAAALLEHWVQRSDSYEP